MGNEQSTHMNRNENILSKNHSRPPGPHERITKTTSPSQVNVQRRLESQSFSRSSVCSETSPDLSTKDSGTAFLTSRRFVPNQERTGSRRAESAPVHGNVLGTLEPPLTPVSRLCHLGKGSGGAAATILEPAKTQHRTSGIDERQPENVAPRSKQVEPENGTVFDNPSKRAGLQNRQVPISSTPSRHSASLLTVQSQRDCSSAQSGKTASEFSSSASISNSRKCHICQRTSPLDITSLVTCSTCRRKYHKGCHKPPILIYDKTWQCFHCNGKTNLVSFTSHQAVGAIEPSRSRASSQLDEATCPPTKRIRYDPDQVTAQSEPYKTQVPSPRVFCKITKASTAHGDDKDEELATFDNKLPATLKVDVTSANVEFLQSGPLLVQERAINESHRSERQVLATSITGTPDSLRPITTDAPDHCADGRTNQDICYVSEGNDSMSKPCRWKSQEQQVGGCVREGASKTDFGENRVVLEEVAPPSGPTMSKTSGEARFAASQRMSSEIIADRIRKRKRPRFIASSLYDEHPEHHPDSASHRYEDRMDEICARPSRKQMFGKLGSRLEKEGRPGGLSSISPGLDHKFLPQRTQTEAFSSLEELLGQIHGVAPLIVRDIGQPTFHDGEVDSTRRPRTQVIIEVCSKPRHRKT